jgi:hypothetical protein
MSEGIRIRVVFPGRNPSSSGLASKASLPDTPRGKEENEEKLGIATWRCTGPDTDNPLPEVSAIKNLNISCEHVGCPHLAHVCNQRLCIQNGYNLELGNEPADLEEAMRMTDYRGKCPY